jgi:tRNA A-37 threonylcarbamoyl transferase component Bud32
MEPQKFGRYEIKGEIGRGGMATVYHAYDPRFEREVALKVLPHEMLHDVQFRTRFEREAKTIAMLEHPAIVPVYDFGEEDGQPYFVMRYMTGGSLSDRMKKEPMTVQDAARIMAHIAPALDEAHSKGIIHRDLKPGNILFDQFNEPYISDFGIAKLSESQANVTGSAIVGTPAYMSPEQAQGESIDGRSDIYGLGIILFELLTGQQPYHGDTPMSVVVKQITDPVPHILDFKPDLPSDIEIIIEKAMAKDRNERFQNVKSLADALSAVARGQSLSLGSSDSTLVASAKTISAAKRPPQSLQGTVIAPQVKVPGIGGQVGLWIGLGAGAVILCIAAAIGAYALKDKIPFLAAPIPTQTQTVIQVSPTLPPTVPAATTAAVVLPVATDTPAPTETPAPSPTPTVAGLPTIGGADLIAFLSAKDIWLVNVDGTELRQLTKDAAEKHDLQWAPDGKSLFYLSGKCIQSVKVPGGETKTVTCFNAADYLDAFEISPDGKQVGISLNRYLYIVPFDVDKLSTARTWIQLRDMKGIFTYVLDLRNQVAIKKVRWSSNGKKIAVNALSASSGKYLDLILIYDLSSCTSETPCNSTMLWQDNFPAARFDMKGYGTNSNQNPYIPSYDWDGESLFVLNSIIRNGTYGYLYSYNLSSKKGTELLPLGDCCYSDARWSPDGTYLLFSYQDISLGSASRNQLYYVPYGSIGTGTNYTLLKMPDNVFANIAEHPDAVLRPGK